MSDVRTFLEEHLRPMAGPYLFAGAGLPMRYAALPSWKGLLTYFAAKTPRPFDYYMTKSNNQLPSAATLIAEAFLDEWYENEEYDESKGKWEGRMAGSSSPLKVEIAKYVDALLEASEVPEDLEDEWSLFQKATFDGVITTNYDQMLSAAFPTFSTFVGQDGLLFSDTQGIAEIYAIHGSSTEPDSLVLTEEDYDEYESRNAYLAAKLMTIFVEHPVLFMGYSFGDRNIHKMLFGLVQGLKDRAVEKLQDRLIFIEWAGAEATESAIERAVIQVEDQLIPVVRITVPDFRDVFAALGERERALPARTLRVLKEQVYDIVKSNDPKGLLYAMSDIDSENAKDVSIVFGVGAKVSSVGIVGLDRLDIL